MITVAAALIKLNGRLLVARRAAGRREAGLWEFPGGKIEPGETAQQCLKRELFEELGITASIGEFFAENIHHYPHGTIRLQAYRVTWEAGTIKLKDHDAVRWLTPVEMSPAEFAPADVPFLAQLHLYMTKYPPVLHDPKTLLDHPLAQPARRVALRLQTAGFEACFAGGCVRDALLGLLPRDIDVATSALPDEVEALFPKTIAVGKAFGVIVVLQDDEPIEVATFRTDGNYADGRRPDSVAFRTAAEDAARRDFTINGLFLDPASGALQDYVGGLADLQAHRVAAIGQPEERFAEDHLRMLRAVRFAGTLGFTIDPATEDAIRRLAPLVAKVSTERIGQEVTRILNESQQPGTSLRLLAAVGLLPVVLPEVAAMQGVEQPPQYHPEGDVFTHTCLMLDSMPPAPRDLRLTLAVLLHDVGKPPTASLEQLPGGRSIIRFRNHAAVGVEMTESILRRLKLKNSLIEDVAAMVGRHMNFAQVPQMKRSTLRRFISSPFFELELELARLDALHSTGDMQACEVARQAHEEFRQDQASALPPRWITGKDLLRLGMTEGEAIGALLEEAYDRQLEGTVPDRAALLAWVESRLSDNLTNNHH